MFKTKSKPKTLSKDLLIKAYSLMNQAFFMAELYENKREITSKYVHATSRGHEAIQLALSLQLKPQDWVSPYYRDDSILLGIGMRPYHLMLPVAGQTRRPFFGRQNLLCPPEFKRPRQTQNYSPKFGNRYAGYTHYRTGHGPEVPRATRY